MVAGRTDAPGAATPPSLGGVRACVFDAYGTLFDVASAALSLRGVLGDRSAALAALWREKQLQYTWLRSIERRHADFQAVTRDALDFALQTLQIDTAHAPSLLQAFDALQVYPDAPDVLRRLRGAGFATAILSNGTPPMLAALLRHAGIAGLFDAVLSVEAVGVFKPDAAVYALAPAQLRREAGQILFVSSNGWDAYGASAFGMRVAWCNRQGQAPERLPGAPDVQLRSLADLPGALGLDRV